MPNWIEAVIAYLKQYTTLRFNMLWFLSWITLLLLVPSDWVVFIDSRITSWHLPYIGTAIAFIPVSFFISEFTRWLIEQLSNAIDNNRRTRAVSVAKKEIQSLSEDEQTIVVGLIDDVNYDVSGHEDISILSLLDKGVLQKVNDRHVTRYELTPFYRGITIKLMVEAYEKERSKK